MQFGHSCGLAVLAALTLGASLVEAATVPFDIVGKAGVGLLAGNENGPVTGTPGSGGEVGAGISYDDVSNVLTLNFGWGTANGFTNLTGNAAAGHIHGPTLSGGTASFTENAGVLIGLDDKVGWNPSASAGGFIGTVTLTEPQEVSLFEGKLYLNAHTPNNPGGEIRGNLVAVPEPASAALLVLGGIGALVHRRRRQA